MSALKVRGTGRGSDLSGQAAQRQTSGGRREVHYTAAATRRSEHSEFRTYFTSGRGVETLGTVWTFLDLTPLGRQEDWEDSPEGYPQTPRYEWWRRHDEYESATAPAA
jgi:predicted dithiol-disulfide oxidoreductase (DUF899 family)